MEGIHLWHNDCLWCVDYSEGYGSPHRFKSQRSSNILLFHFLMEYVFIFGDDCLWCADDYETLDHRCDIEVNA